MPRLLVLVPWPVLSAIHGTNIVRSSGSLRQLREDDKILVHVSPEYVQQHIALFALVKCNSNQVIAIGQPSAELEAMFAQMSIPHCSLHLSIDCETFVAERVKSFLSTGIPTTNQ